MYYIALLFMLGWSAVSHAATATLTWDPNAEQDLAGYKIYRGNAACGQTAPSLFATVGIQQTYIDNTVPDNWAIASYQITAYDTSGNESGRSNCAEKSFPVVTPLAAPVSLDIALVGAQAVITWSAVEGATGYLLRVHEEGTPYEPCESMVYCNAPHTLTVRSVTITVKPGKTYDLWVHAHRADGVAGPLRGNSFTVPAAPAPDTTPPAAPSNLTVQ